MAPFPEFIVYDDQYNMSSQADLENTLLNHGRLRDQHSYYSTAIMPDYPIFYIVGNILATYFNASLITVGHPLYSERKMKYPQIAREVSVFSGFMQAGTVCNHLNSSVIKDKSFGLSCTEPPVFKNMEPKLYNFLYCATPKRRRGSPWDFSMFIVPFDKWTWVGLLLLLVLMSLVLSISNRRGYLATFLSALATLLDNEMTQIRNSKLYILWLFVSLLLFKFYSGDVTSEVIAPPEEYRLEKFSDLEKQNYRFVFPDKMSSVAVTRKIVHLNSMKFHNSDLAIVSRLLEAAKVASLKTYLTEFEKNHCASFFMWSHAIMVTSRINSYISAKNLNKNANAKKCHVGKELFNTGETLYLFTPPGSIRMGKLFEKVLQSGIFERWQKELNGMALSTRVQDRARVKSRASLAKEDVQLEKLRMEGKTLTIFLLWTFCLLACLLAFLCEIIICSWNAYCLLLGMLSR